MPTNYCIIQKQTLKVTILFKCILNCIELITAARFVIIPYSLYTPYSAKSSTFVFEH